MALLIDVKLLCFEQGSKYLFPDEQMVVNRLLFCPFIYGMETKAPENISHLINKGGFICLRHNLCRTGLHNYYCTTESIHKSLKPLVDESETSHHIVLSVVRESETCHKKSQPSQKKSETCVNCVILSNSLLWWL